MSRGAAPVRRQTPPSDRAVGRDQNRAGDPTVLGRGKAGGETIGTGSKEFMDGREEDRDDE